MCTALAPRIGYDNAAAIAKKALRDAAERPRCRAGTRGLDTRSRGRTALRMVLFASELPPGSSHNGGDRRAARSVGPDCEGHGSRRVGGRLTIGRDVGRGVRDRSEWERSRMPGSDLEFQRPPNPLTKGGRNRHSPLVRGGWGGPCEFRRAPVKVTGPSITLSMRRRER